MFRRMASVKMVFTGIVRLAAQLTVVCLGKAAKQGPRRIVVDGDRRLHTIHILALVAITQLLEHACAKTFAARLRRYGNLPDEKSLGIARHDISRDPTDSLAVHFDKNA